MKWKEEIKGEKKSREIFKEFLSEFEMWVDIAKSLKIKSIYVVHLHVSREQQQIIPFVLELRADLFFITKIRPYKQLKRKREEKTKHFVSVVHFFCFSSRIINQMTAQFIWMINLWRWHTQLQTISAEIFLPISLSATWTLRIWILIIFDQYLCMRLLHRSICVPLSFLVLFVFSFFLKFDFILILRMDFDPNNHWFAAIHPLAYVNV